MRYIKFQICKDMLCFTIVGKKDNFAGLLYPFGCLSGYTQVLSLRVARWLDPQT